MRDSASSEDETERKAADDSESRGRGTLPKKVKEVNNKPAQLKLRLVQAVL